MSNPLDKMADNAKELGLDYKPATYTFTPSEPMFAFTQLKPNHNMIFKNQDGKQVGVLDFNWPEMTFTGDADESAKLLFDLIANAFKARLDQERADEREACAKVCDIKAEVMAITGKSCDPDDLAAAIRARGNT